MKRFLDIVIDICKDPDFVRIECAPGRVSYIVLRNEQETEAARYVTVSQTPERMSFMDFFWDLFYGKCLVDLEKYRPQ
jgi:hypothetical protein